MNALRLGATALPSLRLSLHPTAIRPKFSQCWAQQSCGFSSTHALRNPRPRPRIPLLRLRTTPSSSLASSGEASAADELRQGSTSWRPIIFAIGLSVGSYGLAAYYTNKDTIKWTQRARAFTFPWTQNAPTTIELMYAKQMELKSKLSAGVRKMLDSATNTVSLNLLRVYVIFANKWLAAPEGKRVCYSITAVNALVFLAWQIPRIRPFMNRHFVHHPLSGLSYTLVTSIFSHQSFMHFLFNSIALVSFGAAFEIADSQRPGVTHIRHSTDAYHMLAFYLSAGLCSGLVSHVIATRVRLPRLLAQLSDPLRAKTMSAAQSTILPSLGASGAIYGLVAMTALGLPETNVSLIFLPMLPIPISVGFAGMVGLDLLGIIRGWRMFDHWAHLGGAMAGTAYFYAAPWEYVRKKVGPWDNRPRS